jgi:hypothetical protein
VSLCAVSCVLSGVCFGILTLLSLLCPVNFRLCYCSSFTTSSSSSAVCCVCLFTLLTLLCTPDFWLCYCSSFNSSSSSSRWCSAAGLSICLLFLLRLTNLLCCALSLYAGADAARSTTAAAAAAGAVLQGCPSVSLWPSRALWSWTRQHTGRCCSTHPPCEFHRRRAVLLRNWDPSLRCCQNY